MGTLLTTIDAGETSSGCQAPIWKCHLLPAYNRTWRPADAVMVFCNCSEHKHGALSVACTCTNACPCRAPYRTGCGILASFCIAAQCRCALIFVRCKDCPTIMMTEEWLPDSVCCQYTA